MWTQRMGRSDSEFWDLTPREIDACQMAWLEGETAWSIRFGTVAASLYNAQRTKEDQKVFKWTDFFQNPIPTKPQTPEQIAAAFDALTAIIEEQKKRG